MSFAGLDKTCVRFKRVKGGVYRCAKYKKKGQKKWPGKHPRACGPDGERHLISRSRGLIRTLPTCAVTGRKRRRRPRRD